jgi:hypothetical protein
MLNVRRTMYVTEHYAQLQGLRLVPLALCFLGSAAWRAGLLAWLPGIAGSGARAWFLASVGLALIVSFPIGAHYRRRVGVASPRVPLLGALSLTMGFICFVLLTTLPANSWHVSIPVLFVALALGYVGVANEGLRRHYLAIAAGCLMFALAPIVGEPGTAREVALDMLIGFGLLVAGVGDHAVLQRALQTPEMEGEGRARTT